MTHSATDLLFASLLWSLCFNEKLNNLAYNIIIVQLKNYTPDTYPQEKEINKLYQTSFILWYI